jgi:hypothetical protein
MVFVWQFGRTRIDIMDYRLIEENETYQVTYDEGPGSKRYADVVSSKTRVLEEWFGNESTSEEEVVEECKYILAQRYYPFAEKGDHFYLERRENDSSQWRTVPLK